MTEVKKLEQEGWNTEGINGELLEISTTEEPVETEVQEESQEEPQEEVQEETQEDAKPVRPQMSESESALLAKFQGEKKKRQELERIFAQQQVEKDKLKVAQDLIDRGWPEEEAAKMAEDKVKQQHDTEEIKSKLFDVDIKDLARSDAFFADATSFAEDIKAKMNEWKCDAETAYMALRGKTRTKEFQREQEQRTLVKKRQTEDKKVPNAAPVALKSQYKLDEHDKKALAGLQKAQPEAGWDAAKYYKMMKT